MSSGFIAGEALMAVLLAFLVLGGDFYEPLLTIKAAVTPDVTPSFLLSLIVYPVLFYLLVWMPMKKMREAGLPAAKVD